MKTMQQSTIRKVIASCCVGYTPFFTIHSDFSCIVCAARCPFNDEMIARSLCSSGDCLLWRPAASQSLAYRILLNSSKLTPLYKKPSLPICGNRSIRTAISALFFECYPATILWTIAQRIIYAVQRHLVRVPIFHTPFTESNKIIFPFIAHGYSSRSVTRVSYMFFVITSLFHGCPNFVKSGVP